MTKWFKGIEWVHFILCVAFCIFSFINKEYVFGVIFTIITLIATINTAKANKRDKN